VENLTLAQAQKLAMSMETAVKRASELQGRASSKEHKLFNLPTAAGKTCYHCGGKVLYLTSSILRHRNARFVVNKATQPKDADPKCGS